MIGAARRAAGTRPDSRVPTLYAPGGALVIRRVCFWPAGKNVEVTVKTPVPGTDGHLEHGLLVQAEQLCGRHGRLGTVRANWENAAKNAGLLGSSQQDANVAATLGIFAPGTHVLGVADGLSVEKDRSADSGLF